MAEALIGDTNGRTPGATQPLNEDASPPALFHATALPLSSAWRRSEIVSVKVARLVGVWIHYDAGAANGKPNILVLASGEATKPAPGDDVWYSPPVIEHYTEYVELTGTLPSGTAFTASPGWFRDATVGRLISPLGSVSAGAKIRHGPYVFDLTLARWIQIIAQEIGAPANPGTLKISLNAIG